MKMIELHIECYAGHDKLAQLGLESDNNTEWRPCLIPLDAIMSIYPAREGGTIIIIGGEDFRFKESYEYIKQLLKS